MSFYLHKYPYLRLAFPWGAGVFCGDRFFDSSTEVYGGIAAFFLWAGLSIVCYGLKRYSLRWCFGAAIFAFCFTGGWLGVTWQLQQATAYTFSQEETVYRALITDAPETKERTYLCRVLLKECHDSIGIHPIEQNAILYLQQDSAAARLKSGDELLVSARLSPPAGNKNFDEFDYARYLLRRGISATGYVASAKWALQASADKAQSVRNTAHSYREKVIALYRKLGFAGDELAVLSALTIGDKTELSESVRESYSVAGASHILALSGLHIGLLYALLFFLLRPLALGGRVGRWMRVALLLIMLWTFAFFTGLSPSVVRSATMFSVLALADMFDRQALSINTLAATAWMMLLCNPVWLFDVGFQLSFIAVASILILQPSIYRLLTIKHRAGRYVWGLMSVSVAAQVGTAPLVILYFYRYSTHFLLTNLVVIPLVTIILYAAVVMLLLTPALWVQAWVAEGVKKLLELLNVFVRWVEQLPYSSIDGVWLYPLEVLGMYVSLLLLVYYVLNRRYKHLVWWLSFVLLLGVCRAAMVWVDRPRTSLVFYNVRGCPAVHCIASDGRSWIHYADTIPNKKLLRRAAAGYWNRHRLRPPEDITTDCHTDAFFRQGPMVSYRGRRVCMVADNRWRNKETTSAPYAIDYLYLCKGFDGSLAELTTLFVPGCVVLDASLSDYRRSRLEEECRQSGLRFISLSAEGSVCFLL